jgi:hypothetical protein
MMPIIFVSVLVEDNIIKSFVTYHRGQIQVYEGEVAFICDELLELERESVNDNMAVVSDILLSHDWPIVISMRFNTNGDNLSVTCATIAIGEHRSNVETQGHIIH